jgi:hypothetical protein
MLILNNRTVEVLSWRCSVKIFSSDAISCLLTAFASHRTHPSNVNLNGMRTSKFLDTLCVPESQAGWLLTFRLLALWIVLWILPSASHKTPWPESASELYRPIHRRLSAKLVPTFANRGRPRGYRDGSLRPYSRISRPEPLLFLLSISSVVLTRLSGPSSRPTASQKIW